MAIIGLGTDIVEIGRLENDKQKLARLASRILTARELDIFEQHSQPVRFLAKRFAAKEAAVKALGTGIGHGVSWQHIEISNEQTGAPVIMLSGGAKTRADQLGSTSAHISIADERHYAIATVILSNE